MAHVASFSGTDRFHVRAILGEGATGRVYRVLDRETSREVALKTLRLPPEEALYRLKQEFRTRKRLAHPNLLQFHELFVEEERCFFTMEVVDGVDFLHWARGELHVAGARGTTLEAATTSADTLTLTALPEPPLAVAAPPAIAPPLQEAPRPEEPDRAHSWQRLRRGLDQLFQSLEALHAVGLVHRDIKPTNILVNTQERVIVLDFGLAIELHAPGSSPQRSRRLVGTPAYMAPEQVTGEPVTPAADLYALGAVLYEVLSGAPPFAELEGDLLEHKVRSASPPHVLSLAPRAPADLAALAMELLSRNPAHRPGATQCRNRLGLPSGEPLPPVAASSPGSVFVGRPRELEVLTQALEEVAGQRHQVTVHLHGPAGIGKSTLVRHFALQASGLAPVVLQGRCHSQEIVPYKALDACIDDLARYLERLPAAEPLSLSSMRATALARLFPVLKRLPSFQRQLLTTPLPDASELRRQGALALRELIDHLARGPRPLMLWIDDVQWGDTDSALLFEELLRPPAPPVLLVLSWRSEDRTRSPLLRHLLELTRSEAGTSGSPRELTLEGLSAQEVGSLATALLGSPEASSQVQAIVAQAEGNPFIASQLARHVGKLSAQGTPDAAVPRVELARLVVERIQSLSAEERALMEVATLSGRPLAQRIVLQAAGLDEGGRTLTASLSEAGLLRESPGEAGPSFGVYHDLIREALLNALPVEARRGRHRAIAEALTARDADNTEALLLHWEGAGEPVHAGHYAVRSADRAALALAFEHAVGLYRKGLELLGSHADRPAILEKLAEALANLGQAPEAARHYLEAAQALGGSLAHQHVRDLKRRAAEQYLKSGRFDEGWRELHPVLRALDIPIPGSFFSAVWAATWRRLLFLARGVNPGSAEAGSLSAEEHHRLEVLWSACTSWTMVNPMLSDAFRTMHLLGARRLGACTTLNRALVLEAVMELHMGGRLMEASAQRILGQVRQRVEHSGGPYDKAWYELARVNQGYTRGRWGEVVEAGERAEALFREHCPGSDWERVTLAIFYHHALAMRGELRTLAARLESFQHEARRRGDLHAHGEAYLGEPVVAWLARDRADEARARAEEALAAQSARSSQWPESAYRRQQFANLIATVYSAHYRGEPWPAWAAVLRQWDALRSSFMLSLRTTGLNLRHMRARAALAAASTLADARSLPPEPEASRWRRPALLADVREQLRAIERDPLGCSRPLGQLLRAALAWQEADAPEAQRRLEEAVAGFQQEDMGLYREAARYALGALRGGAGGQALQRQAQEWMETQGTVRPGALAAALAPGLPLWEEAARAQRA